MEQITSINQSYQISKKTELSLNDLENVSEVEKANPNKNGILLNSIEANKLLTKPVDLNDQIIQSPLDYIDTFPEIIEMIYGQQVDAIKDGIKMLFNIIKFVAQKLGGWDNLIDLILLVLPMPPHVKLVLEVLKKILPVLCPLPKNSIPDFLFTAISKGDETNTIEELLTKIADGLNLNEKEISKKSITNDIPSLNNIMADKNMSLEDKVMYILLSLADKEEKEIIEKSKKLDNSDSDSRQRLMIELQIQVQKLTQTFNAVSNLMKAFHDASMNAVRNFR